VFSSAWQQLLAALVSFRRYQQGRVTSKGRRAWHQLIPPAAQLISRLLTVG
jgi:hypothetical protein